MLDLYLRDVRQNSFNLVLEFVFVLLSSELQSILHYKVAIRVHDQIYIKNSKTS